SGNKTAKFDELILPPQATPFPKCQLLAPPAIIVDIMEACELTVVDERLVERNRPLKSISVVSGLFSFTDTVIPSPFIDGKLRWARFILFTERSRLPTCNSSFGILFPFSIKITSGICKKIEFISSTVAR